MSADEDDKETVATATVLRRPSRVMAGAAVGAPARKKRAAAHEKRAVPGSVALKCEQRGCLSFGFFFPFFFQKNKCCFA